MTRDTPPSAETARKPADSNLADILVGRRLRALRLEAGLSLADLAGQAGISVGALSQIERGVSSLRVRTIWPLAAALGISTEEARQAQGDAIEGSRIGCWNSPFTDHIGSWAPFSHPPTQYLGSVDGAPERYGHGARASRAGVRRFPGGAVPSPRGTKWSKPAGSPMFVSNRSMQFHAWSWLSVTAA